MKYRITTVCFRGLWQRDLLAYNIKYIYSVSVQLGRFPFALRCWPSLPTPIAFLPRSLRLRRLATLFILIPCRSGSVVLESRPRFVLYGRFFSGFYSYCSRVLKRCTNFRRPIEVSLKRNLNMDTFERCDPNWNFSDAMIRIFIFLNCLDVFSLDISSVSFDSF